jgi:hypothetical protein
MNLLMEFKEHFFVHAKRLKITTKEEVLKKPCPRLLLGKGRDFSGVPLASKNASHAKWRWQTGTGNGQEGDVVRSVRSPQTRNIEGKFYFNISSKGLAVSPVQVFHILGER